MKIIEIGFPQPLNNMVINKSQLVIYRAHYDTHCPNKNTQCAFKWVDLLNKWYVSNLHTHQTKSI